MFIEDDYRPAADLRHVRGCVASVIGQADLLAEKIARGERIDPQILETTLRDIAADGRDALRALGLKVARTPVTGLVNAGPAPAIHSELAQ